MNKREFFEKVAEMRKHQKDYFRTRNPYFLARSKELEKEVDREIERVRSILDTKPEQPRLFD